MKNFNYNRPLKFPLTLAILNSVKKLLLLILEETFQTHLSTFARNAFMLNIRKNLMNMMDIVLTVYLHHHQYLNQNQKLYLRNLFKMIRLLLLLKFLKYYNNKLSNRTRTLNNFNNEFKNLKTSINNCFVLSTKTPSIYNRELKPLLLFLQMQIFR